AGRTGRDVVGGQREGLTGQVVESDANAGHFLEIGVFGAVEQQAQLQHIDDAGGAEREAQDFAVAAAARIPVDLVVALALHAGASAHTGDRLDADDSGLTRKIAECGDLYPIDVDAAV